MLSTSSVIATTSTVPLPVLEEYDVSPKTGFVPTHGPLARLSQEYFEPWEQILDQLNPLLDSKQFRNRVDEMPLLDVSRLESRPERQRAYTLLSIIAHSYVWGQGLDIAQSIPEALAVPWQTISDILDIPPVLTYASNDLWNWKLKDPKGSYDIDNLVTIHCMTGTSDEDWFVIVSIAVEIEGGAALQPLLDAMHAVITNDPETVLAKLKEALCRLEKVGKLLARMFERCDPAVFYWKIRKFLTGSGNAASLGLPNGLEFKGVNNNERKHHMGATAGQSSLFPALDVILGIQHFERKSDDDIKRKNILLAKMKKYMPAPHRAFLDHLSKVANIRPFVLELASENTPVAQELASVYDGCVHQIKLFRDTHIQIVTRYIMTQAKRGPPEGWEDYRVLVGVNKEDKRAEELLEEKIQLHGENLDDDEPAMKGTGGSDLMPFLKQNRDETNAAKVRSAM